MVYTLRLFFPFQNAVSFIILTYLVPVINIVKQRGKRVTKGKQEVEVSGGKKVKGKNEVL